MGFHEVSQSCQLSTVLHLFLLFYPTIYGHISLIHLFVSLRYGQLKAIPHPNFFTIDIPRELDVILRYTSRLDSGTFVKDNEVEL